MLRHQYKYNKCRLYCLRAHLCPMLWSCMYVCLFTIALLDVEMQQCGDAYVGWKGFWPASHESIRPFRSED